MKIKLATTLCILSATAAFADETVPTEVPAIPGAILLAEQKSPPPPRTITALDSTLVDTNKPKPVKNLTSLDTTISEQNLEALQPQEQQLPPLKKPQAAKAKAIAKTTSDDQLLELQIENETLKQRSKISEAIAEATQKPSKARFIGADTVYEYQDGAVYRVYGGKNDITDIMLQPGEILTSEPVAGDTVRWVVASTKSGTAPNESVHILIKPHYEGISTTMMIATNRHVYKLLAQAVTDWHQPGVRWDYPQEEAEKLSLQTEASKQEEMATQEIGVSPEKLDWKYSITGDDVEWKPVHVYNDGKKTYMQMPDSMATNEAPAFFVLDEDGNNMLVNYRVKNGVYIVDRLFNQGVLKVGLNQEVKITRDTGTSNWFESATKGI